MGFEQRSMNSYTRVTAWLSKGQNPGKNPLLWSESEGKVVNGAVRLREELDNYSNQLARNLSLISDLRATLNKPFPAPAEGQEENPELPIKRDELKAELNTLENQVNKDLAVARELADSFNDRFRASQSTLKNYAEQLQEMVKRALSLVTGLDQSTTKDVEKLLVMPSKIRAAELEKFAAERDPSKTVGLGEKIGGVIAKTNETAKELESRQGNALKAAETYLQKVGSQVEALRRQVKSDNEDLSASVGKAANFFKADPPTVAQIQGMHDQIKDRARVRSAAPAA